MRENKSVIRLMRGVGYVETWSLLALASAAADIGTRGYGRRLGWAGHRGSGNVRSEKATVPPEDAATRKLQVVVAVSANSNDDSMSVPEF